MGERVRSECPTSGRVLILVENAPLPYDRRVLGEARSLVSHGYSVSVICPAAPGQPLRESLDGIEVRRYRPARARGGALSQIVEYAVALLKTFSLMVGMARDPGFDVVQACNPPDLFFAIAWPFRLGGTRFIFDQHDLSPELYSTLYGRDSGLVMALLRWSEAASYRSADAVIASNESYKRLACDRGGVDPRSVFVVRNGPREGWPLSVEPDPSLKRGKRHLVVYMGVMGYQDGVDVLLDAVHTLVVERGFTDVHVQIVGDGNAAADLRAQTARLGIGDHVEFAGWVQDERALSRYLRTADVCVCPEPSSPLNDHSTFIKVMEYMAAQTPIVAFDLPETRYSAADAALYAAPGDVDGFADNIHAALTDELLRAKMAEAAASRIGELRWERQVPLLLAAYDHALTRATRR